MQMNFVFAVMDDTMMLGVLKSFIVKLYNICILGSSLVYFWRIKVLC